MGAGLFTGCTKSMAPLVKGPDNQTMPTDTLQEEMPQQDNPRVVASLCLTKQGKILIESGKPDEAIRTLEQAVNLNPVNGLNFYYLAEAWFMKGNLTQAEEFNYLAGIHLDNKPEWKMKVLEQEKRISRKSRQK